MIIQPCSQALSSMRRRGGKTLAGAGHVTRTSRGKFDLISGRGGGEVACRKRKFSNVML